MRVYHSLIFTALLALSPAAYAQTPPALITITGEGEVSAAPDMATLSLGVTSTAKTAKEVMDANAAQMTTVLANLSAAGIAPRDLQTSALSLQANWTNSSLSSSSAIDGYTASNQLSVRVHDLAALGTLIDGAIIDGANTFNNVQFAVTDPAPLLDEARQRAVADARHRAEIYATAAGITLGPVLTITEGGTPTPGPQFARAMMDSTPIAAGEVTLSAAVTITWAIAN
ncbi:SIMPL domain-containing protein [Pseudorhodobacter ferrugineus]|uniref:SIMPL domain-containing protein n=1 Tax=Pseudorhodobacter ferrugineus TaxID=77008 RepID=UPI0003B71828|nr:SIMPL domain-containing protein [Pseudorhodobacter ferrugineus]